MIKWWKSKMKQNIVVFQNGSMKKSIKHHKTTCLVFKFIICLISFFILYNLTKFDVLRRIISVLNLIEIVHLMIQV
jgi:hypothetical protein